MTVPIIRVTAEQRMSILYKTLLQTILQSLIFKKGEFRNKAPEFYEEAGGSHNIKMRNTMRQIYTNMALL